jgi:protein ImuB
LAREARNVTGLDVRVGLAGNRFAAQQAARAARPSGWHAVPPGQERSFLSPLPLVILPTEAETLRRLNLLGIRTLGALARLPRLALIRQFGPQAGFLHDLASGADPRPILSEAPPLTLEGAWSLEPPAVDRGRISAHAARIVTTLAADISRRGYQVEGLRVTLEDETGEPHSSAASVKPPSADSDQLARRLESLLERLSPPHPIVDLSVTLYPLRPAHLGATQLSLFTGPADGRKARLQEALRRLRQRFGEMIIVIGSLLGPPLPRPIQVTTDPVGLPRAVVWPDHILPVDRIYEHWRENRRWWSRPVLRDYYRAETCDGQVRVLFCERSSDRWWLERRYL